MKKKKTEEKKPGIIKRFFGRLKSYLFTGILVTAPVSLTFYIVYKLILFIDRKTSALVPVQFRFNDKLPFDIPGLGFLILLAGLIAIGMFTRGYFGRFFVRLGEKIVSKMPFISSIYNLLKQVFETFFSDKKQSFNQVVLLQYPRKGLWVMGFVSAPTEGETQRKLKEKMLNVFVPTTPNPTSGFLLFVPKKDVIELNMSVEDGLKLVISCGIVSPDEKLKKKGKK